MPLAALHSPGTPDPSPRLACGSQTCATAAHRGQHTATSAKTSARGHGPISCGLSAGAASPQAGPPSAFLLRGRRSGTAVSSDSLPCPHTPGASETPDPCGSRLGRCGACRAGPQDGATEAPARTSSRTRDLATGDLGTGDSGAWGGQSWPLEPGGPGPWPQPWASVSGSGPQRRSGGVAGRPVPAWLRGSAPWGSRALQWGHTPSEGWVGQDEPPAR